MAKTQQAELLLQSDILGHRNDPKKGPCGLRGQGFYAEKQSERFKAGRPDIRAARNDLGQLDIELKVCDADVLHDDGEIEFGFTTLQWLHLKSMNEHGIPAVGLVYLSRMNVFLVTVDKVLHRPFTPAPYTCLKLPAPRIIDGAALFEAAKGLLNDRGYRHHWRF